MPEPTAATGLFSSLQRMLGTLHEIAQVRLDLLGTEVEFEKRRLFDGLLWGAVSLVCIGVGMVMLCGFVILLVLDDYRLAATGVLALLFLAAGALLMRESRQRLRNPAGLFDHSVAELGRDAAGLRGPSPP